MAKNDYFKDRNDEILRWLDEQEIDVQQELTKYYENTKRNVEKDIFEFYAKYAKDEKISPSEAQRLLRGVDLDDYHARATQYYKLNDILSDDHKAGMRKRLDLEYKASQIRRIEALHFDVVRELGILTNNLDQLMSEHFYSTAEFAYSNSIKGLEITSTLNRPAIRELVSRPFKGANYSDSLWGNTDRLALKLKQTFSKGFAQGLGVREMAQELRKDFNVGRRNAETIVRTDGNHIVNNATLQRYQDAQLTFARIHVHIDDRTSATCIEHDKAQKLYTIGEETDGILPAHYNCRSTWIPDDEELMEEHWVDELDETNALENEGSWFDRIKDRIKQMTDHDRDFTLEDVLAVGDVARNNFTTRAFEKAQSSLVDELKFVEKQLGFFPSDDELRKHDMEQYLRIRNDMKPLVIRQAELQGKLATARMEYMSEQVSKVRSVGGTFDHATKFSSKDTIARMNNMSNHLPSQWVTQVNSEPVYLRSTKRGYFLNKSGQRDWRELYDDHADVPRDMFNWYFDEISISGSGHGSDLTAIHEMVHLVENRNPQMIELERLFYEKRTKGEELQRLRDVTKVNYSASEVTKVDDFLHPYAGKDYGGVAYEIMSMGVEDIFGGKYQFENDAEYYNFVLGMLLTH